VDAANAAPVPARSVTHCARPFTPQGYVQLGAMYAFGAMPTASSSRISALDASRGMTSGTLVTYGAVETRKGLPVGKIG
jgi:acid phosphatase family membrane protein YuiD